MSAVSVISRIRLSGAICHSSILAVKTCTKSVSVSCRGEMLRLMGACRADSPRERQRLIWLHTSSRTSIPSGTMRPLFSAMVMKSSGMTVPRFGWRQRMRASSDDTAPVLRLMMGW